MVLIILPKVLSRLYSTCETQHVYYTIPRVEPFSQSGVVLPHHIPSLQICAFGGKGQRVSEGYLEKRTQHGVELPWECVYV